MLSRLFTSVLQTLPAAGETLLEHIGITSHFLDEEAISLGDVILSKSLSPLVVVVEQGLGQGFGAPHECPLPCVHGEFFAIPSFFILKHVKLKSEIWTSQTSFMLLHLSSLHPVIPSPF